MNKGVLIIIGILLISFVSASLDDCSVYGTCKETSISPNTVIINDSTFNVNDSLYWAGHPYPSGGVGNISGTITPNHLVYASGNNVLSDIYFMNYYSGQYKGISITDDNSALVMALDNRGLLKFYSIRDDDWGSFLSADRNGSLVISSFGYNNIVNSTLPIYGTNISAQNFIGSGKYLTDIPTSNSTYNNLLNQNCEVGRVVNGTNSTGGFICTTVSSTADVTWIRNGSNLIANATGQIVFGKTTNFTTARFQGYTTTAGDVFTILSNQSATTKGQVTFGADAFGRAYATIEGSYINNGGGGAYFQALGQQEAWFTVWVKGNSAGKKIMRFGNLNDMFSIQLLTDAGTAIVSTPFSLQNDAPTNSLAIASNGDVNLGAGNLNVNQDITNGAGNYFFSSTGADSWINSRFGINTLIPSATLDVNGNARIVSTFVAESDAYLGSSIEINYSSSIVFTKADYADPFSVYDSITPDINISRGDNSGIFNVPVDGGWIAGVSPTYTEWSKGACTDFNFGDWNTMVSPSAYGGNPNGVTNMMADSQCMHTTDGTDKYFIIKIIAWTPNNAGGGFTWNRTEIFKRTTVNVEGNNVKIDNNLNVSGNLNVNGNITGNIFYGGMWFDNDSLNGQTTTIGSTGVWYNVSFNSTADRGNNKYGIDTDSNSLICLDSGMYQFEYSVSFESTGTNKEYNFAFTNGTDYVHASETHQKISTSGDSQTVSSPAFIRCTPNLHIYLNVRQVDAGASNVGIHHAKVSMMRVGN